MSMSSTYARIVTDLAKKARDRPRGALGRGAGMNTIAIVSQKGGAGKTTLAIHLAAASAAYGLESVVFDTDPQATAVAWGEWRLAAGIEAGPEIVDCASPRLLAGKVALAEKLGAQLVVIDTPPAADATARAACALADLILIPCRPQAFDLSAIETTADLVKSAGARAATQAFVVWVGGPPRAPVTYAAASELVARLGLPIAPLRLPSRAVFHHASGSGRTAGELEPDNPAGAEAALLAGWALGTIGVSTRRPVEVAA